MAKYTETELKFLIKVRESGYTVVRGGWPDFIIYKDGKTLAVEVKKDYERKGNWNNRKQANLSKGQQKAINVLRKAGLVCSVWRPNKGFTAF